MQIASTRRNSKSGLQPRQSFIATSHRLNGATGASIAGAAPATVHSISTAAHVPAGKNLAVALDAQQLQEINQNIQRSNNQALSSRFKSSAAGAAHVDGPVEQDDSLENIIARSKQATLGLLFALSRGMSQPRFLSVMLVLLEFLCMLPFALPLAREFHWNKAHGMGHGVALAVDILAICTRMVYDVRFCGLGAWCPLASSADFRASRWPCGTITSGRSTVTPRDSRSVTISSPTASMCALHPFALYYSFDSMMSGFAPRLTICWQ